MTASEDISQICSLPPIPDQTTYEALKVLGVVVAVLAGLAALAQDSKKDSHAERSARTSLLTAGIIFFLVEDSLLSYSVDQLKSEADNTYQEGLFDCLHRQIGELHTLNGSIAATNQATVKLVRGASKLNSDVAHVATTTTSNLLSTQKLAATAKTTLRTAVVVSGTTKANLTRTTALARTAVITLNKTKAVRDQTVQLVSDDRDNLVRMEGAISSIVT